MPLIPISYPKSSNPGRHGADGTAKLVNAYLEQSGEEGKTPLTLFGTDGLKVFADRRVKPTLSRGSGTGSCLLRRDWLQTL